jgi:uncharacterized protein (DUF488 family)
VTIYTIGFAGKTAEQFFTLLINHHVARVVDVRLNNVNQLAGFSKRDDLRYFLRHLAEIDYVHLPRLAPSLELLEGYRGKSMSWPEYEEKYMQLLRYRSALQSIDTALFDRACLLCSEAGPEHCHRRLLAEYIGHSLPGLSIVHL